MAPSPLPDAKALSRWQLPCAALLVVRRWCETRGHIPWELLCIPTHLQPHANKLKKSEMLHVLSFAQHDEKDIFRTRGVDGLPDFGDGETQGLEDEYRGAVAAVELAMVPLRSLPPRAVLSAADFAAAAAALRAAAPLLDKYMRDAMARVPQRETHAAKLRKRAADKPAQAARLAKHILFLTEQIAEAATCQRRMTAWAADVAALPATPAAEHTSSVLLDLLKDHQSLLKEAFSLAQQPASKALAVIFTSAFQSPAWTLGSLFFTVDETKTWEMREAVHRALIAAYERSGTVTALVGADKAYISAAHWDLAGHPLTRTAAKKLIEYMSSLTQRTTSVREVSVKNWPFTADLCALAKKVLAHPKAAANGVVPQPWMDDFVSSQTRERWRDFLVAVGIKKISVTVLGIDGLERAGVLEPGLQVTVPSKSMLASGRKALAITNGLLLEGQKIADGKVKELLAANGITQGTAHLRDLSLGTLGKLPHVRRAWLRLVDAEYRQRGRDFAAAYSYPQELQLGESGPTVPLALVWDKPHDIKNERMASAHAMSKAAKTATAPGTAPPPPPAAAAAAEAIADALEEDDLFAPEDETIEDIDDEIEWAAADATRGTLAYDVGVALQAVIDTPGQTLVHPRTLDPTHDPQHVPTALRMFSHATAAAMSNLGHARAAAWVEEVACEVEATDKRGFCVAERWRVWAANDDAVLALHPSLRWEPDSLVWHSPKTASIEGYSRVVIESKLITNDSNRLLDVMVGADAAKLVYDRRKGSDLCESFFSTCVDVMGEKVSKRCWLRMLAKIMRQTRRKTMAFEERKTAFFTDQHKVYLDKTFQAGFRSCVCLPRCVIGGPINSSCVCAGETRHATENAKLMLRSSTHAESSTRHKFHTDKSGGVKGGSGGGGGGGGGSAGGGGGSTGGGEGADADADLTDVDSEDEQIDAGDAADLEDAMDF